jgi:hypothetical protein
MAQELPILQCTLDTKGAKTQAARYAEAARHVTKLEREPNTLVAALDAQVDQDVMRDLLETERACCSFFEITYDGERLTYATEHVAALDVIQEALSRR